MTEKEFIKYLAKLEMGNNKDVVFVGIVEQMMALLDETDCDDYFGTEGWKHHIGLE